MIGEHLKIYSFSQVSVSFFLAQLKAHPLVSTKIWMKVSCEQAVSQDIYTVFSALTQAEQAQRTVKYNKKQVAGQKQLYKSYINSIIEMEIN